MELKHSLSSSFILFCSNIFCIVLKWRPCMYTRKISINHDTSCTQNCLNNENVDTLDFESGMKQVPYEPNFLSCCFYRHCSIWLFQVKLVVYEFGVLAVVVNAPGHVYDKLVEGLDPGMSWGIKVSRVTTIKDITCLNFGVTSLLLVKLLAAGLAILGQEVW